LTFLAIKIVFYNQKLGSLIITWGFLDIGLGWIGTDLYYAIGIQLPVGINPYTGIITMLIGGALNFFGRSDNKE